MSPGQQFVQWTLSVGIEAGFKPGLIEGAKPVAVIIALTPGIKGATQLPGTIDDFA
jgi:hypothetical protein